MGLCKLFSSENYEIRLYIHFFFYTHSLDTHLKYYHYYWISLHYKLHNEKMTHQKNQKLELIVKGILKLQFFSLHFKSYNL